MPEQQDRRAAAPELRAHVVAAGRLPQRVDAGTRVCQPPGKLGAAAIDCRLVGARRFETNERFDGFEERRALRLGE
jgi:hypothetical protein